MISSCSGAGYWPLPRQCFLGCRTSKIHAAVDTKGRPLRVAISGGNVHDSQMMHAFLDWKKPPLAIIADKAYGGTRIRRQIAEEGALRVVPATNNARNPIPHDSNLYAMRNIVERFFCKMKDMRGLSTRCPVLRPKLPRHAPSVSHQVLDQLSPHPNWCLIFTLALSRKIKIAWNYLAPSKATPDCFGGPSSRAKNLNTSSR